MPHSKLRPSFTFDEDKIIKLKQIAPEAFADGKINWDTLKENLGDYPEDSEEANESFGLNWPGKKQSRKFASLPSKGTLVPVEGEGINEESTKNIFIEGENLEVLKILQKSYAGKVKIIYIDPPYNKGKDFVYDDDFVEPLQEYLKRTGQIDEEGKPLTTNTRADGRFHSKWLSMMYPRLRLARNLLRDDGVIFISIDDSEVQNLLQICNEIFGEENFIDIFSWVKTETPANLSKKSKKIVEFILCYMKVKDDSRFIGINKSSSSSNGLLNQSNKISVLNFPYNVVRTSIKNKIIKKGVYGTDKYDIELLQDTEVLNKVFIKPISLKAKFKWTQSKLDTEISEGTIINIPTEKLSPSYERLEYDPEVPPNLINSNVNVGTNENAGEELSKIFGEKIFDYPKPVSLIEYLIGFSKFDVDDIVLDFFAGSGTTAEAIFSYNLNESEYKKFILVQFPEEIKKDTDIGKNAIELGFNKITEISKERIKRISSNYFSETIKSDCGFKVFKLKESNFQEWKNYSGEELAEINVLFEKTTEPLVDGWKERNVLFEILLIEGFPLDSIVETNNKIKSNNIYNISSNYHEHKLIICLDKRIEKETIKDIVLNENDTFICLDSAITDENKVNLADKGLIKTI